MHRKILWPLFQNRDGLYIFVQDNGLTMWYTETPQSTEGLISLKRPSALAGYDWYCLLEQKDHQTEPCLNFWATKLWGVIKAVVVWGLLLLGVVCYTTSNYQNTWRLIISRSKLPWWPWVPLSKKQPPPGSLSISLPPPSLFQKALPA